MNFPYVLNILKLRNSVGNVNVPPLKAIALNAVAQSKTSCVNAIATGKPSHGKPLPACAGEARPGGIREWVQVEDLEVVQTCGLAEGAAHDGYICSGAFMPRMTNPFRSTIWTHRTRARRAVVNRSSCVTTLWW